MAAHAYNFTTRDSHIRLALVDFAKARVAADKPKSRALLKLSRSTWSYPSVEYKVDRALQEEPALSRAWIGLLKETVEDPLGPFLDRYRAETQSKDLQLFDDLLEDQSDDFGSFLIDSVEIPVLLFDPRNDNEQYNEGMNTRKFLKFCLQHARTTPFAIHFLRHLDAHLFSAFGRPHNATLLQYPRLIRFPLDGSKVRAVEPIRQPTLKTTLTTKSVELKRVFVSTTRLEIKKKRFLERGPQPWSFPVTDTSRLPAWYSRDFDVRPRDISFLACDEEFMTLFAITVQLVVNSRIKLTQYLEIILTSIREIFVAAMECPFYAQVSCVLAHVFVQYIGFDEDLKLTFAYNEDAKALLALAVGCNPERARLTTESFFVKAQAMYRSTLAV